MTYSIVPVRRLELTYEPQPWPYASDRRAEIDAYFEKLRSERAGVWNGTVLLMHRHRLEADRLTGAFMPADFASLAAWREWGYPEAGAINCFAMGALQGSDGAWLLGVMGAHTASPGRIYFPAGTPDTEDIAGTTVDLAGNVAREVAEETGLTPDDYAAEEAWICVHGGARMALMKVLRARERAEPLRRRILAFLAAQNTPELADIHIVRSRRDYDPMMPSYMTAFLDHARPQS